MKQRWICLVLVAAAAGCGSSASTSSPAGTSVARGTLALSTFPSAPTAVVATTSKGKSTVRATPTTDGAFSLALTSGADYALSVEMGGHQVPLALPRKSGSIDHAFHVGTAAGGLDLGSVRYRAAGGTDTPAANDPGDDACEGEDGAEGSKAKESADSTETPDTTDTTATTGAQAASSDGQGDGECENGIDAKTKAPCTDAPDSTDATDPAAALKASDEMCVPENDPPSTNAACGGAETEAED